MKIPYGERLAPKQALKCAADWLMEQRTEGKGGCFFRCLEDGKPIHEWYMVFYPIRGLLLAGALLGERKYIDAALKYVDIYVGEQLPNGGFTSNYRQCPTGKLTKQALHDILRNGKVNVADVGSNAAAIVLAAQFADQARAKRYLDAVRNWFDNWVAIWALPEGGYGNGIWEGHKLNCPYTCGMSTVAMAFSAFGLATGEYEYIENAERTMAFQATKWLPDGRPVFMNAYPVPSEHALDDYSHYFYLLEGMCWTHHATRNRKLKKVLAQRIGDCLLGEKGLIAQWNNSWFNFMTTVHPPRPGELPSSRLGLGVRLGWEMAKSNGLMHVFAYYLNHIAEHPGVRAKYDLGMAYLTQPLKARMSGVMSDPDESYGAFAVQATGFACLSYAEAMKRDAVFAMAQGGRK